MDWTGLSTLSNATVDNHFIDASATNQAAGVYRCRVLD